jgi:hypothetical protein
MVRQDQCPHRRLPAKQGQRILTTNNGVGAWMIDVSAGGAGTALEKNKDTSLASALGDHLELDWLALNPYGLSVIGWV